MPLGTSVDQPSMVTGALVTDPDPGDLLFLDVEQQPLGTPFTGVPTHTSSQGVSSGSLAYAAVPGLADDTGYHWQARARDQTGATSPWVSFGGNPESEIDFLVAVPETPALLTGLGQFGADSTTAIAVGGNSGGLTVVLQGTVSDPDPGDMLTMQVELQVIGAAFTDAPSGTSTAVSSGATASVALSVLLGIQYHWQARTCDQTGRCSAWTSFGGNPESNADLVGSL